MSSVACAQGRKKSQRSKKNWARPGAKVVKGVKARCKSAGVKASKQRRRAGCMIGGAEAGGRVAWT